MSNDKGSGDLLQEVIKERQMLRVENDALAQQVKRLIRAESKIYEYQQELDSRLNEYKELYDLSKKIGSTFDIRKIFEYALEYIIRNLQYGRVIFLEQFVFSGSYAVCAFDGYYSQKEKESIANLVISQDDPLVARFLAGNEYYICKADSDREEEFGKHRARLLMDEYLIYPLCSHTRPHALLVVGNSAENAEFYRRVSDIEGALLGIGNLVGLVTSAVENHIYDTNMQAALEQRKQAEEKYRTLVDNINIGIYRTLPGHPGYFIQANPAMAKMFGYESVGSLMETPVSYLYRDAEDRARLFDEFRAKSTIKDLEIAMKKKDGTPIWVSVTATVQYDSAGQIKWADGVMEDITDRKKAREELQSAHDELEMRVQDRTADLARTNELLHSEIAERRKIEERLRELSEKDPLTGIYNRRKLFELLTSEIERAKRYKRSLSLIMFDFDHFKAVNDTYGHNVGDIVLTTSATAISGIIRKTDIFSRYGGEEFMILIPESALEGAVELAEKIRVTIERKAYPEVGNVTISLGVAQFTGKEDQNTFVKRTDDALYAAKKGGRNRVEPAR